MNIKLIFQRFAFDIMNPLLLRVKKNKKYSWDKKYLGLNIGCGLDNVSEWIGIDGGFTHYFVYHSPRFISKLLFNNFKMSRFYTFEEYFKKTKEFKLIHFNIIYGLPFSNCSVPNLYSSHFLEHLSEDEGERLLKEAYRILKPGGTIRIAIPSLDNEVEKISNALKEYHTGNVHIIQKYVTNEHSLYISDFGNHKHMYNFIHLERKIKEAGFFDIIESNYKSETLGTLGFMDTRSDSIFIEARKPLDAK